jgi:hypothetical protein
MSRAELIEKTVSNLEMMSDKQLKEISDFAEFLLMKRNSESLSSDISSANTASKSYQFLEEDEDIYTLTDVKEVYQK